MDRVNGADWFDIGGGKRGFRGQNAGLGIPGTEVTETWLNAIQEELAKVIESEGIALNVADNTQLWQALRGVNRGDIPVDGYQSAPPGAPAAGARYIVQPAGTGAWAGHNNELATWSGTAWVFSALRVGTLVNYYAGGLLLTYYNTGAGWTLWAASDTQAGPVELATVAETKARASATLAVTPAGLGAILGVGWRGAAVFSTPGPTAFAMASYGLTASDKVLGMLWGAGGGGASAAGSGGAGGSAGGFSLNIFNAQDATITIGAAGAGNTAGSNGGAGGTTSFGSVFSATGGNGGSTGLVSGGNGVGGLINLLGGSGEDILNIDSIMHWASGGAAPLLGMPGFLGVGAFGYANGGAAYYKPSGGNVASPGGNGLAIIVY